MGSGHAAGQKKGRVMLLKLAIVGRPNVGKSTLFNRLAGKKLAIVHDMPGVTRDRKEAEGQLADLRFTLVDTAGYENVYDGSIESRMREQTETAVREADIIVFLIDARAGVLPDDMKFAELLRRSGLPVILAANKAEGKQGDSGILDAWSLGLGDPVGLSAEHGEGMAELYQTIRETLGEEAFLAAVAESVQEERAERGEAALARLGNINIDNANISDDALVKAIEDSGVDEIFEQEDAIIAEKEEKEGRPIRLVIVGRPNSGKSTLINKIIDDDRLLTGPEAGITRDSVRVDWEWDGHPFQLVDTAGLRKRARVAVPARLAAHKAPAQVGAVSVRVDCGGWGG